MDVGPAGAHDPLLLAETLRQAGILLSHDGLGVPADFKLLMDRMSWNTHPRGLPAGTGPADVVGCVRIAETRRRTPCLVSMRIDVEVVIDEDGSTAPASNDVVLDVPPPVDRIAVGVCHDDDVVLGAPVTDNEWLLRVLTGHAVLFDHPLDHVPGMLILEGMRQAGRLLCAWPEAHIADCDVTFSRFVELDAPSSVRATLLRLGPEAATLDMEVRQQGATVAAGTVGMRTVGPARR